MKRRPREDVKGIAPDPHEFKRLLSQLGTVVSLSKSTDHGQEMLREYDAAHTDGHGSSTSESGGRISLSVTHSNPTLNIYSSPAKKAARNACIVAYEACSEAMAQLKKADDALKGVFPRQVRSPGQEKNFPVIVKEEDLAKARQAQERRTERGEGWGPG